MALLGIRLFLKGGLAPLDPFTAISSTIITGDNGNIVVLTSFSCLFRAFETQHISQTRKGVLVVVILPFSTLSAV